MTRHAAENAQAWGERALRSTPRARATARLALAHCDTAADGSAWRPGGATGAAGPERGGAEAATDRIAALEKTTRAGAPWRPPPNC